MQSKGRGGVAGCLVGRDGKKKKQKIKKKKHHFLSWESENSVWENPSSDREKKS